MMASCDDHTLGNVDGFDEVLRGLSLKGFWVYLEGGLFAEVYEAGADRFDQFDVERDWAATCFG